MSTHTPPQARQRAVGAHLGHQERFASLEPLGIPPLRSTQQESLLQALQLAWPGLSRLDSITQSLLELGRPHRIQAKAHLLLNGDPNRSRSLWLLSRGSLSMGRSDSKGVWRPSQVLEPGDWIEVASAWCDAPYPETALALTAVVAHEFPASAVFRLCLDEPALLSLLLESLGRQACAAKESRQALSTQDFPSRLAEWLLQELASHGQGDSLVLRQFKRDLAALLGVTPETLSRTLRDFHTQGVICMNHKVLRIPDVRRLEALRPAARGGDPG